MHKHTIRNQINGCGKRFESDLDTQAKSLQMDLVRSI